MRSGSSASDSLASDEALFAGMAAESVDQDEETVLIWPENERTARLFLAMKTQWRMIGGGMGPLLHQGLRYDVLLQLMPLHEVPPAEVRDELARIQLMEDAALAVLNAAASRTSPATA